jgi:S1-C subfamily serine protease
MKDFKNYMLVGIITAIIIYWLSPYLFGNRIEIVQAPISPVKNNQIQISYSDTFEKVKDSVVSIYTRKSTPETSIYYKDRRQGLVRKKQLMPNGQGSGVIISSQGHIVTNFHVIAGSDEILVMSSEGKEFSTAVIGVDPLTDLAILKINNKSKPISLGNIEEIKVGDVALAIGNPFGVGQTITLGIISATDKEISPNAYSYQRYVQTDAAINPGNSGGALVNINGELIGINVSISTKGGGSDGIGFAIPVDIAKRVIKEIIETGEVERGFIGISAEKNYKGRGVLVNAILKNGPGDSAGVKHNDVIRKIDNIQVNEIKDVQKIIGELKPGQIIMLDILRQSKIIKLEILVSKMSFDLR